LMTLIWACFLTYGLVQAFPNWGSAARITFMLVMAAGLIMFVYGVAFRAPAGIEVMPDQIVILRLVGRTSIRALEVESAVWLSDKPDPLDRLDRPPPDFRKYVKILTIGGKTLIIPILHARVESAVRSFLRASR